MQQSNSDLILLHSNSDPSYLHSKLENLSFRIPGSSVEFLEKVSDETPYYSEKTEKLTKQIAVDFYEVQSLLKKIETPPQTSEQTSPHLFISDFTLKKNSVLSDNFYNLDLELIKRDYKP